MIGRHLLQIDTLRDASPEAIISLLRPGFQALTASEGEAEGVDDSSTPLYGGR